MNPATKMIKDLRIALKDFESMVKDPRYLWNGRDIKDFSLRPREAWANWLICAVLQKVHGVDVTFMEDEDGDGILFDTRSGNILPTEHVSALNIPKGERLPEGEQRIIDAINLKIARGPEYAKGKTLVVFFDGAGIFYRSKIRENIFKKHAFESVFCVGLATSDVYGYIYTVTEFRDSYGDNSVTHKVHINEDFSDWVVSQIME